MEIAGREGMQECSEWWSQLPNNLKEDVLAWLPVEKLCRYCGVNEEWNALLSSTQFIASIWVVAPPNKKPWLVFFDYLDSLNCMVYCFFTDTWKRLSFAFLKKQYDADLLRVHGSAQGLFLATIESCNIRGYVMAHIVFNPLSRKSTKLPCIDDGVIWAMTIVAEEGHGQNGDTFKLMAVVTTGQVERVKMYDSNLKSWTTVGHLPHNLRALWLWTLGKRKIVVNQDFLYLKCVELSEDENSSRWGIAAFSIQSGVSVFTPLPLEEDNRSRCDVLFTCQSRVLLGSYSFDLGVIIISELENSRSSLVRVTEIARMPPHILDDHKRYSIFNYGRSMFDCEGTRDLVRIRFGVELDNEVLVYNLSQNTWTWLTRFAIPRGPSLFFEPRPDMEVE